MKKGDDVLVVVSSLSRNAQITPRAPWMVEPKVIQARVCRVSGQKLWWTSEIHRLRPSSQRQIDFSDRGVSWCPAWREKEAAAFRVAIALGDV